jgi:DNA invertase Pin-like site-specific DNA recombinase
MTLKAIRYIRWSTLEQGNKDRSSEERQINALNHFIASKGWEFEGEPFIDSGRSAYTGENLTKGYLGAITKRILSHAVDPTKAVLVVEELNRLSRQPPSRMQAWMMPLLDAGLTIAIAKTGQIVTKQMIDTDIGGFMMLMMESFSANGFSRQQRDKGNASWTKRRRLMEEGQLTARHRAPKWLEWDESAKAFVAIPLRKRLIREIFALRLSGKGKGAIAKLFNERMVIDPDYATWACGKRKPELWEATYIGRILCNRATIGFLQCHNNPRGAEKKVTTGKPVKVYPAVITEDTFNRANDQKVVNQLKHQGRGQNLSNLLGTKARCSKCGGQMSALGSARVRTNKDGSTSQHYFLYCRTAKASGGTRCDHHTGWTYSRIEQPLLDALLNRAMDDQHFTVDDDDAMQFEGAVFALRRRVDDETKRSSVLVKRLRDKDGDEDEIAVAEYEDARKSLKAGKKALEAAQAALAEAKGRVSPSQHLVRVSEVRARMESPDADERYQSRSTVKAALQGLIDRIEFDDVRGRAIVHVVGGLALMFIDRGGKTAMFDLHKAGRDYSHSRDREAIKGYIRRKG